MICYIYNIGLSKCVLQIQYINVVIWAIWFKFSWNKLGAIICVVILSGFL